MGMAVLRYKPTYYLMSGQNSKPIGMRTTVFRGDGGSHGLLDMRSHQCLAPQHRITLNLMRWVCPIFTSLFPHPQLCDTLSLSLEFPRFYKPIRLETGKIDCIQFSGISDGNNSLDK